MNEKTLPGLDEPVGIPSDWTVGTTVGEIVAQRPLTARVFELVGIDYCCGGKTTLGRAADESGVNLNRLMSALHAVGVQIANDDQQNWQQADLIELTEHIVERHHSWLRRELPPLLETTNTVRRVHADNHPELAKVAELLQAVYDGVIPHLKEEEDRVFPVVRQLVAGNSPEQAAEVLEAMRNDHDELGSQLHELRNLTNNFAEPEGACAKYREMMAGLQALERDMLTHVHLENNILLPRALKLLD